MVSGLTRIRVITGIRSQYLNPDGKGWAENTWIVRSHFFNHVTARAVKCKQMLTYTTLRLLYMSALVPIISVSSVIEKVVSLRTKRRHLVSKRKGCLVKNENEDIFSFVRVGTKVSRLLSFAIVLKQKVVGT